MSAEHGPSPNSTPTVPFPATDAESLPGDVMPPTPAADRDPRRDTLVLPAAPDAEPSADTTPAGEHQLPRDGAVPEEAVATNGLFRKLGERLSRGRAYKQQAARVSLTEYRLVHDSPGTEHSAPMAPPNRRAVHSAVKSSRKARLATMHQRRSEYAADMFGPTFAAEPDAVRDSTITRSAAERTEKIAEKNRHHAHKIVAKLEKKAGISESHGHETPHTPEPIHTPAPAPRQAEPTQGELRDELEIPLHRSESSAAAQEALRQWLAEQQADNDTASEHEDTHSDSTRPAGRENEQRRPRNPRRGTSVRTGARPPRRTSARV